IPFIMTVFNPLSLAGRLVESEKVLVQHLQETPDLVQQGLSAITETFRNYVKAIREVGASGLFFATTTWGSKSTISSELYGSFARPTGPRVRDAPRAADFTLLPFCGDDNRLFELKDYPVHAVNWAATSPSNPTVAEAVRGTRLAAVAGISREALTAGHPNQ